MTRYIYSKDMKSSMHNYIIKIRNHENKWVQTQDIGDELAIRGQQVKTISYTYRLLYQNFRITANQKSTIDTQTKKKQLKYNTEDSHHTRRGENKRRREEKRVTKTNPKQLIKWQ